MAESEPARRNTDQPASERSSDVDRPEEFQRFEKLLQKLVKVPKSELDAKRKAS